MQEQDARCVASLLACLLGVRVNRLPRCRWMSEEYRNIAKDATQLAKELETQPRAVEYLSGIITDLFVDKHKFKGHNVRRPQLRSNSHD